MQNEGRCDILIIGGGIAGCIAAISIVRHSSVTLVDKLPEPVDRIGESLAPVAQRILRQLNLMEGLENGSYSPVYIQNPGMQSCWGNDQVHIVDYLRNPDGLGMNLDRKAFEIYLREVAIERGVQCMWPAQLSGCDFQEDHWHCTVKSHDSIIRIRSKFVIDATGRQSHFARKLGIKRQRYDKLVSYWASLTNLEDNKMSTISASQNGWWYSAVVPNNRRVVAFQTDSDLIETSRTKSLDGFMDLASENVVIHRLLERNKEEICYHGAVAANSSRLNEVAGNQWSAIGDAVISFDPLSSQGMFHAMANAMQLKELILKYDIISNFDPNKMENFKKEYTDQIDKIWDQYIQHKDLFYRQERRWIDSIFWKRRHQALDKVKSLRL